MTLSNKQGLVMLHLQKKGSMTMDEAVKLIGKDIYYNERKYVGEILSRMVKRNLLIRVKPGVFELNKAAPKIVQAKGWWED